MPKKGIFNRCNFEPFMVPCEWSSPTVPHEALSFESNDSFISPKRSPVSRQNGIVSLTEYDVLCGRGGKINSHPGNLSFRKLIKQNQALYLKARRKDKVTIANSIVDTIHKNSGRFLKRDHETGGFIEIDMEYARHKTCQALRENAPSFTKEHNIVHVGARKSKHESDKKVSCNESEASDESSACMDDMVLCQPMSTSVVVHKALPYKRIRIERIIQYDTLSAKEKEQFKLFEPPHWLDT